MLRIRPEEVENRVRLPCASARSVVSDFDINRRYKVVVVPSRSRVALLLCNLVLAYVISHGKLCFSRMEIHESMRSLVLVKENGRLPSLEYVAGISTTDKSQQDCHKAARRFNRQSEHYGHEERKSKESDFSKVNKAENEKRETKQLLM
ncbi:hypothetical protein L484_007999 [Morus notabilis]|uniref:Uncharacterized protein n=1 Tax=Morus notabilis TaxID=981085 RepID=W9QT93_9ROSA|nr:hypothetical protein L484_007999 [Morus notabilis]